MEDFQYFFAKREALETIVYLYDVVGAKDRYDLMRFDSTGLVSAGMFDESCRRYVVKMATGAGKTKVLSLVLAWSFFHRLYELDSTLARNFLVIAPNIIVLDRIRKDFDGLRIFFQDPVLPDNGFDGHNWRDDFQLTLHVQDEVRVVRKTGNIFLTNIHRVYAAQAQQRRDLRANRVGLSAGRGDFSERRETSRASRRPSRDKLKEHHCYRIGHYFHGFRVPEAGMTTTLKITAETDQSAHGIGHHFHGFRVPEAGT